MPHTTKTLILTSSRDITTDILMPHLTARAEVFRFNIDLWRDYRWSITADGYELSDPTGRTCREEEVGAVYERKVVFNPIEIDTPACGNEESWLRAEVMEIWAGIKDLAYGSGKLALIHPSPTGVWHKMRQMRVAARYFPVLPWQMLHGTACELTGVAVAKSNSGKPMGEGRNFFVSRVQPERLDVSYPWFLQQAGEGAHHEVTVAYVAGKLFASELDRRAIRHTDSRAAMWEDPFLWHPCSLSPEEEERIRALMRETGFSFARLDFLRMPDGLSFLELNPNGQFAWLDLRNERGLMTAIADEVMRVHDAH